MKRTGKLFVFLRLQRHVIFDELLQHKLEQIHTPSADEATTVPAALLVMVMLLQAYTKCSDDEAVRRAAMDKAWQMVLDCNGKSHAPFSKKTLVNARKKLIELDLESHVLRRTADIARQDKGFDHKKIGKLRIAIDSAPLAGAGRVEDTLNLLGSALAVWLSTVATLVMVPAERIIEEAGLQLLTSSSIKAGMDLDWASPDAVTRGLHQMKSEIERAQTWVETNTETWVREDGLVARANEQMFRIVLQDIEVGADHVPRIRRGVTKDRLISVHDPDIRHGRKSKSERIDGYKRYVATELGSEVVLDACVLPANKPERDGADKMKPTIETYGTIAELAIDRAFLSSDLAKQVDESPEGEIVCRPYGRSSRTVLSKADFKIDLVGGHVVCPTGEVATIRGRKAQFAAAVCNACDRKRDCRQSKLPVKELAQTPAPEPKHGRTVTIHEQEGLLIQLRVKQATPEGRVRLRERVEIEHELARICNRQGPSARYFGVRKNDFDVRRYGAIDNLFVAQRADLDAA